MSDFPKHAHWWSKEDIAKVKRYYLENKGYTINRVAKHLSPILGRKSSAISIQIKKLIAENEMWK